MLTEKELFEIKTLQEICEKDGGFDLKLNFDMLKNRTKNQKEDFFHYEDDQLVGFLGTYSFGNKVEICGMVHPDYRRKGIFTKLLELGLEASSNNEIETILLNAPTESQTAKEFLKNLPCTYSIAEYQMKWHSMELHEDSSVSIRLSESAEDWEALIELEVLGFGLTENEAREMNKNIKDSGGDQNIIIEAEGKTVGKMRVSDSNGEAWIYGFTIFPELRGKGIGRKALSKVVMMENEKGLPIFLEVEARNAHALGLYESCGFRTYHSQDYYLYQK
ncbi:GNAT family N-acetyltransferase [Bacillus sp. MRMR6]|uniref:GNAT family N-acetyltransferase n=1 Tax=Bacillus sp. MRMR6 TaxID=1928617 RepID=UPI0009534F78|nr:GNAT family N-acetyltransferase [Bacillus sp. MRMR6]OLS40445.1 GNAT family N-acetyltransferase [Bacillus sp. MRMR6]